MMAVVPRLQLIALAIGATAAPVAAGIQVVSSSSDEVVLEVTTGALRLGAAEGTSTGYDRAALEGASFYDRVGAPRVPVLAVLVAIPSGSIPELAAVVSINLIPSTNWTSSVVVTEAATSGPNISRLRVTCTSSMSMPMAAPASPGKMVPE